MGKMILTLGRLSGTKKVESENNIRNIVDNKQEEGLKLLNGYKRISYKEGTKYES